MSDPAKVHANAIVIDTHADTPQRFVDEHWNFTDPLNGGMLNYDSAKKGNLDAQFFSIWVDPGQYAGNASARRTLELIDGTLEQVHKAPNKLQLCTTADQIIDLGRIKRASSYTFCWILCSQAWRFCGSESTS